MYDILVVVIPQPSTQLLIVHLWFVLPEAPPAGHLHTSCRSATAPLHHCTTAPLHLHISSALHHPKLHYLIRVGELELPAVAGPGDELLARLVGEQLQQELGGGGQAGGVVVWWCGGVVVWWCGAEYCGRGVCGDDGVWRS